MQALQFKQFGDVDKLEVVQIADPIVETGMAIVRVEAASINPSDVKNVAGAMKQTTLPRIPGRDFAGVVAAGPAEWIGVEGVGHGWRRWLYPRWDPCGADRSSRGELAPQAGSSQLRPGCGCRGQLRGRLVRP